MRFKSIKGDVSFLTISLIISIVSFGVILSYFTSSTSVVSTNIEDNACRALISGQSSLPVKLSEFFFQINNRCMIDEIKEDFENKDELFKETGEELSRCWYRYGEGEYDFLSNWDTEGRWCMLCGTIESENEIGEFSINEFVKWTEDENNYIELKDGTKSRYIDYVNFKYYDIEQEELLEISKEIENLNVEEPDEKFFADVLLSQYQSVEDLYLKKITTQKDQKNFIVYRFDRIEEETLDEVTNAMIGAGAAIGGGLAVSFIVEEAIMWGGTAAICAASLVTGPAAPVICGATVAAKVTNTGKNTGKILQSTSKILRIQRLSQKLKAMIVLSKESKIAKLISSFSGSTDELLEISTKLDNIELGTGKKLGDFANTLKKNNIDDFGNIDDAILNFDSKKENLYNIFSDAVDKDFLNNNALNKIIKKEEIYDNQIKDLKIIQEELEGILLNNVNNMDKLTESQKIKLKDYLIGVPTVVVAIAGAEIGANLNYDNRQYVDILTEEEYYRTCGTRIYKD